MTGVRILGSAQNADAARCHPKVHYKGLAMEWDYFEQSPGMGVPHTVCPRCTNFGLISSRTSASASMTPAVSRSTNRFAATIANGALASSTIA